MSGIRQQQHPWLADHVIFCGYRWLALIAAGAGVLWQGMLQEHGWLLLGMTLINLLATAVAPSYVRIARRNPSIMTLDIVLATLVLVASGSLSWLFALYAASSLVLPGLLFGWQGGIMTGLAFVALDQGAYWASGRPATTLIDEKQWVELSLALVAPPVFGCVFPWLVALLRRAADRQAQWQARRVPPPKSQLNQETRLDSVSRFALGVRDAAEGQRGNAEAAPLAARAPTVRAVEQGLEDLRRIVFAPFPTADIDLPAALDLLATRYGQHTGVTTRVTLLGRVHTMHRAHRTVLIRLAQEALLNVQQHAHAALIELTLRYDAHSVALLIQDDGVGLLDGTYERPGLHALRAMHYRLVELGGRLDVFETEGGGVTVRATMPLE